MAPDIWFPNLGIEIQSLSRVLFSVFGFEIYWYAVLIVLGISAAYLTVMREVKRTGQRAEDYNDLLMYGLFAALVGLRLFYVAFSWDDFRDNPIRIITGLREGGLAIFGGIIASIISVYVLSRIRKINVWLMLDTCAPAFILGQAIGRWGNFINREAYGGFTNNLFAMAIVREQAAVVSPELLANTVIHMGVEYIQVHPTFLYESVWNFTIFALLSIYRPRKRFNGEIFWLYLLGYGFARFFIEGLRTDQLMMGAIPISQLLAAFIFLAAALVIALRRLRLQRNAI